MLVDEEVDRRGTLVDLELRTEGGNFRLSQGEETIGMVSATVIEKVCRRYSRPLEEGLYSDHEGESLPLRDGLVLRVWNYKAPVDLEFKRYLVLEEKGQSPLAVLSRQFTNALRFVCAGPSSSSSC